MRIQWIAETSNQCKGSKTACKRTIQAIAKRKQTLRMLFHYSKCHCLIMVLRIPVNVNCKFLIDQACFVKAAVNSLYCSDFVTSLSYVSDA